MPGSRAVLFLPLLALASAPPPADAQWRPAIHTETDLGEAGRLRLGASGSVVLVSGEAFYRVHDAPALQLFVAVPVEPFDEMRLGLAYSRHRDELHEEDVLVRMVWFEPLLGAGEGHVRFRYGVRAAYIHQSRAFLSNTMHGVGGGATAGVRRSLGRRAAIEASMALTGVLLPGTDTDDTTDRDYRSNAWFREFRIGFSIEAR